MKKMLIFYFMMIVLLNSCQHGKGTKVAAPTSPLAVLPVPFRQQQTKTVVLAKPVVRADGIFYGDKGLLIDDKGPLTLVADGKKIGEFYFFFNTPWAHWIATNYRGFQKSKMKRDLAAGCFIFTGKVPLAKRGTTEMPMIDYQQKVHVLNDGRIQIDIAYHSPGLAKIKDRGLLFAMPFAIGQSQNYLIDNHTHTFPEASGKKGIELYTGYPKSFTFSPTVPQTEFKIDIASHSAFYVRDRKERLTLRLQPDKNRKISFILDLRKVPKSALKQSSDTHAGIDFWKSDRLHVPNFSERRNLVQNPSFEAGLRYYNLHDTWGEYHPAKQPIYSIDRSESKFGNSSLLILARKNYPFDGFLQTFALPVKKGKQYTVSFYAKGQYNRGLRLKLRCITAKWLHFPPLGGCAVDTTWKRYNFTFTAPNNAATILIGGQCAKSAPSATGKIWLDGLQVEEGINATAFSDQPLSARLITSDPDNFLDLTDPVNAQLSIFTKPETAGTVDCSLEDYFGQTVWKKQLNFMTNNNGIARISLPLEEELKQGIYVLRVEFELADGYKTTDFFRLSRMKFLQNKHRNKDIFASTFWMRSTRFNDIAERAKHIGIGSMNYVRARKIISDTFKKNGVYVSGLGIFNPEPKATAELTKKIRKLCHDIPKWKKMTPERIKIIEEASYEMAASMPWIEAWFFARECEAGGAKKYKMLEDGNIKEFVKLFIATYRGVKRVDKNKKVYLSGGPCNMMPQGGIRWLDRYLDAIDNELKFDGIAIHPYRTLPEDPDLDDDTVKLLEMLKKHGYDDVPVYWNEGIYYAPYQIPAWGLSPHKGCSIDHFRAYSPSYHMGWGERISASYFARSWLVALKYQERIKQFNGWCSWMQMDAYLTPFALQKVPNTLGHLLGNAVFKEDIRFAPGIRCYVFEDDLKRPVAAIWSHLANVDRGIETCPSAELNFKEYVPQFIDLMGNSRKVNIDQHGTADLPLGSAPLFIRGKAGSLDYLCHTLRKAKLKGSGVSPLKITAQPVSKSVVQVRLKNLVSRDVEGRVQLNIQGKSVKKHIKIAPKQTTDLALKLKRVLSTNRITSVNIPVSIQEDGEQKIKTDVSFDGFSVKKLNHPLKIDGKFDDWNGIPVIRLKNRTIRRLKIGEKAAKVGHNGDFEARMRLAWDRDFLYLAVQVVDDKFVRLPDKYGNYGWYNDTLQVYLDTLADARSRSIKGFDGNDYNYDFFPNPDNHNAVAYRRFAPEQQIAGGLLAPKPSMIEPNIRTAFTQVPGGYSYEVAFPRRYIAPLQLKAGTVAGLAIQLNDRDGKRVKAGLTTTPAGTEGYMNPHLYPIMILVE